MRKDREEEPVGVRLDFGVVYSLYMRPRKNGTPRAILKVSWDEDTPQQTTETHACTFEVDFERERLIPLGRKGAALPARHFSAERICRWAKETISEEMS